MSRDGAPWREFKGRNSIMSFQSYVSLKGQKQGQLKGDSRQASRRGKWIEVVEFKQGTEVPFDTATGRPSGRRSHGPITITKENGVASPQLLSAHYSSEMFDEIVIETVGKRSHSAPETVHQRITLTNASVCGYRPRYIATGNKRRALTDFEIEFEKIEFGSY